MTKKYDKNKKYKTKDKIKTKKGQLFSDDNPDTTVNDLGFTNKEKALYTINDMKHRDITYQFQVINTMINRAKVILKKTKDPIKKQHINNAIIEFDQWLKDYKLNNRGKNENYDYLPLKLINDLEFLAEFYNISKKSRGLEKPTKSDNGFLEIWCEVKGDKKKLRNYPIKAKVANGITWDKHRNMYIQRRLSMIQNSKDGYFYKSGKFKDLPTKLHVNMIMNGYSPYKNILKNNIIKYKKIINNITNANNVN